MSNSISLVLRENQLFQIKCAAEIVLAAPSSEQDCEFNYAVLLSALGVCERAITEIGLRNILSNALLEKPNDQ
ncbi:MAG: hypothetical protein COA43_11100 [Robiginitomaculum sp.]|nr:MAG: hypothetical protein COA43_11100 [Robiginitomaculum sp.]